MSVTWFICVKIQNATIVDFVWTSLIGFLSLGYALFAPGFVPRKVLAVIMSSMWSLRLGLYIFSTRIKNGHEDPRYTKLHNKWGGRRSIKFFLFFQLQGICASIFALPVLIMSFETIGSMFLLEYIGLFVFLTGLIGESLADYQLYKFKQTVIDKTKTCRKGLWMYSRHPNYFFEWIVWIGFFITALSSSTGWITFICPALMLYLLVFVSGIPYAEARAIETKGADYRKYQAVTSAFIPWFIKKGDDENAVV